MVKYNWFKRGLAALCFAFFAGIGGVSAMESVRIGFDGAYGLKNSTSAQSIEMGLRLAIDEINTAGGVLGGRPLALVTADNRSVPARGIENLKKFAADPNLVAVVGGRFSPVLLQQLELVHHLPIPLLDAWGSADGITDHAQSPSYSFRISLRDKYAMPIMLQYAASKGSDKVALLVPNTGWGRSNTNAAERYIKKHPETQITLIHWYNWGEKDFSAAYQAVLDSGAQALVMVANDLEGSIIVRHVSSRPQAERLPIISHWGVTGGAFVEACGPALQAVDFSVVQTFSMLRSQGPALTRVVTLLHDKLGIKDPAKMDSPVGFAHAYDLVHILARAINLAGSIDRVAVRDALEQVRDYAGLVRNYDHPFPAEDHNGLKLEDVFMARFQGNTIVPITSAH
ncbi:amino acid/amide ABC transporter substrate-binding protein, HAAT family [Magnetococcus marinus MC-1]|uniref:Amino acid/amide ABC transporter substrate-binding protein, HAAT family n=1 Tax=Magnetococcus marinus (strain ATCC BAA-1437 / JCM 17883 / MC-1) TaxID=156889 RepID=A0LB00_MAGMM|nr:ABC transporter substrate-binding protein [Magnetococcus marinus]ABK45143.1 amino acid/amide ABC transporter substrate-binding protein, HAAT family [Magnetococcus marinus MC-1]